MRTAIILTFGLILTLTLWIASHAFEKSQEDRKTYRYLADALASVPFEPFELCISTTGIFERKSIPRAVWAGVERSEPLERLHRKVERVCQQVGLPAESRKFIPHITLARLNMASGPVAEFLSNTASFALPPWTVQEFVLFESELRPEGSIYTPIVRYPARI